MFKPLLAASSLVRPFSIVKYHQSGCRFSSDECVVAGKDFPIKSYHGLLSGCSDDLAVSKYYSSSLSIKEASRLFLANKNNEVRDAKSSECSIDEYLRDINRRTATFLKTKNHEVYGGQDTLKGILHKIMFDQKSILCLMLGGETTNDAVLFRQAAAAAASAKEKESGDRDSNCMAVTNPVVVATEDDNRTVLMVNLHGHQDDLVAALLAAVDRQPNSWQRSMKAAVEQAFREQLRNSHYSFYERVLYHVMLWFLSNDRLFRDVFSVRRLHALSAEEQLQRLQDLLAIISENMGYVTVVLQEAESLACDPQGKQHLEWLIKLAKQDKTANVVLASSDHLLPFQLEQLLDDGSSNSSNSSRRQHQRLLRHVDQTIYTSNELSPREMHVLLTQQCGVQSQLAQALISVYGGQVDCMAKAIQALAEEKESYQMSNGFPVDGFRQIQRCFEAMEGSAADETAMLEAMQQLATTGLYLASSNNPIKNKVVKVLHRYEIAGLVRRDGKNLLSLLDPALWQQDGSIDYGLVPSSQSMRILIAVQLEARQMAKVTRSPRDLSSRQHRHLNR